VTSYFFKVTVRKF